MALFWMAVDDPGEDVCQILDAIIHTQDYRYE